MFSQVILVPVPPIPQNPEGTITPFKQSCELCRVCAGTIRVPARGGRVRTRTDYLFRYNCNPVVHYTLNPLSQNVTVPCIARTTLIVAVGAMRFVRLTRIYIHRRPTEPFSFTHRTTRSRTALSHFAHAIAYASTCLGHTQVARPTHLLIWRPHEAALEVKPFIGFAAVERDNFLRTAPKQRSQRRAEALRAGSCHPRANAQRASKRTPSTPRHAP